MLKLKSAQLSFILLTLCLLLPLVITGCGKKAAEHDEKDSSRKVGQAETLVAREQEVVSKLESAEIDQVTIYYLTSNEEYLVPVTVPVKSTRQGAKVAIERLIVGAADEAIKPVINTSTKLRDLYLQGNRIYLDFTSHLLSFETEKLGEMAITGILKTLEPFAGNRLVQILIEGEPVELLVGKYDLSQPLEIETAEAETGGNEHLITVYYSEQNGVYLVPVMKKINSSDPVKAAIAELVKGPGEHSGLIPTMWHGTKVYDVDRRGDLVTINLSKEAIGYGGGTTAESMFVRSLLLTVTEFPEVNQVQLLFEGEILDFLPEGTEVDKPLSRPDYVNYRG